MSTKVYDHNWQHIRLVILERDDHTCQIHGPKCTTVATQVDHVTPISEGGARLDPDNLRAACAPCNIGRQNTRNTTLTDALTNELAAPPPSRHW